MRLDALMSSQIFSSKTTLADGAKTVWILGDQLTHANSALRSADSSRDCVLMIESRAWGSHLRYHKIKLAMIYAAMRHFAEELRAAGWRVDYHHLADTEDFSSGLERHIAFYRPERLEIMAPNSYFEQKAVEAVFKKAGVPYSFSSPVQFLRSREDFEQAYRNKKRLLMETHYREMRVRLGLLVDSRGAPQGGRWNFDAENRLGARDWVKAGRPVPPPPPRLSRTPLTQSAIADVERFFPQAPGKADNLWLPVSRKEALVCLDDFIQNRLPMFGEFEDLMIAEESRLFHSSLSAPINIGLLDPLECAQAAEAAWRAGRVPLNAAEGFIRQIIGWREFINGVYWLKMPDYLKANALEATRDLPRFFYTAQTELKCLQTVLRETLASGFNHHIQRLMILGNFMLLAGVDPGQVLRWFSEMYVDAFEWVMAANVLGMALYADGGFMATKPYAGSGSYISRMSNYCKSCRFKPNVKSGTDACPFNVLYWHFYNRHAERFARNPRTAVMVKAWRKRDAREREVITSEAQAFLESIY